MEDLEENTVKNYLKYGVSAIALLAAFSLAQAQERQGGERGTGAQQTQGSERGAGAKESQGEQGGAMKHEGATQHQGAKENRGGSASQKGDSEHGKTTQQERGKSENRAQAEHGKAQPENRQEMQTQGRRAAKNAPTEEQKKQTEGEHNKSIETRQRESNIGAAGKSETLGREGAGASKRASIHISGTQRTELHDVIRRDAGIRRYHRGEVHFSVNVGTRIPEEIEFFAPPPRFVEIDPEFRNYKIIVLEDEILVVDPVTREIVDVIPT